MGTTRYHEDPEDLPEVQKSLLEHAERAGSQEESDEVEEGINPHGH